MSKTIKLPAYIAFKLKRTKDQFRLDTFKAGGKGGSNQNSTDSGVRITDLVTGISVDCREERKQGQNRKKAFERLVQKMIDYYKKEHEDTIIRELLPAGSIRTYKLTKGIVIDHRTGGTYDSNTVLNGKLDQIHEDILINARKIETNESTG